ncbi:MBL fold metallo-hydrolase (plasmid) [Deinococcus psychrotolerans]|uniref:MBL fold metallo-hydrolase n=1 Tax=Deinococcus psychrotolerans TaxID=2489213 RepID=A0A3G8YJX5_9DEIO|nr:excalibur calcium-binding domain-containing protein [Deinococcus psychrotolerans]AZI44375.1 MBL fold metallo-hydrolase [Deinococcus psychrotolerans]AZI45243.1 MBL fold metallo-hydrolase [Deinococcus psychrotolerans]
MTRWLTTGLLLLASTAAAQGNLIIRFLDVGQGDAVLITSPEGKSLIYDGGRSETRMRELIQQYQIKNVSLVAASHADADHITGLVPVVEQFRPQLFLNNGLAGTTRIWSKLTSAAQQAGTKGLVAQDQVINLGSVKVTVIPPPPGMKAGEQNTHSVGLLIQYGTFKALMTGDSETAETEGWLKTYPASALGPIDVYKSIHHGAKNGDHPAWLSAVRPSNVVISVGPNNYGHPTTQALALYAKAGAAVYRTDLNGTVTVTVQPGGQYTIKTERGKSTPTPTTQPRSQSTPLVIPATPPAGVNVSYANCTAVRAAGKAPIRVGEPGYSRKLDRDGDGIGCE